MARFEKILLVLWYFMLLRLSTKMLESMNADIFERISHIKEEIIGIESNISYCKVHGMPTTAAEMDKKECEEYLQLLRHKRQMVGEVLKAKRVRSPFFAR